MNRAEQASFRWPSKSWLAITIVLGCILAAAYWMANSLALASEQGSIELSQVSLQHTDNGVLLNALADVNLPATMQAGLDNGLPLTFILNLRLIRPRPWWPDKTVAHFQKRYTLTYYELTRHYRVYAVNSNTSRNFRSLSSALKGLGQFKDVGFELGPQQKQPLPGKGLIGSIVLGLDTRALPLPLQPLLRSSWSLASMEYRWPAI